MEFLGLDEQARYSESDFESALISHLEKFLLELGKGFLFEARQKRFTFDGDHYFLDLVFYNRLLRCYVVIDLKLEKLSHQDLGQMQMYVNYYDREVKLPDENPTIIPLPEPAFEGKIGETYKDSEGAWPKLPAPPAGAPNVVVILLDDVGFGQTGTFGGPIPTPALDKLASNGLRYTRFHTTAICGPSRAALITGRNHHNAGSGFLAEWATGFPSYNNMIPKTTASVAATLKGNGYATSWFGKNHNTPDWESSVAGPFDRWPTGMGFEYFYGFIGGETHQYYPVLFENTRAVEPKTSPDEGYHLMTDMTDRAINYIKYSKSVAPQKPFFMYFAPGAAHAPHHAPKEWSHKFKGRFDQGWEKVREETYARQLKSGVIPADTKLTPRPEWVPAWESLSADQKKLYLRLFENFAGYLAFTDHECGRLSPRRHA